MRSIERRFIQMREKYPSHCSYIHFLRAIRGQNFSESSVRRWFHKLVDKDDIAKGEVRAVLRILLWWRNIPEDDKKRGINRSRTDKNTQHDK